MADRKDIRDGCGRLLGRVGTLSDGRQELRDASNRLLGRYDARDNRTRDASNRLVTRGDSLTRLLDEG